MKSLNKEEILILIFTALGVLYASWRFYSIKACDTTKCASTKNYSALNDDGNHIEIKGCRMGLPQLRILGFKIEEVEDKRREFWVSSDLIFKTDKYSGHHAAYTYKKANSTYPMIHAVELKPGEKILSRQDIEKAWHFGKHYEGHLEDLLKELGFEE